MSDKWSAVNHPIDAVGQPTQVTLENTSGSKVVVRGTNASVWALIDHLTKPEVQSPPLAPMGTRFVLADPEGHYMALALEFPPGSEIGLLEIESVERFASEKVGRSMVALHWVSCKIPPQAPAEVIDRPATDVPSLSAEGPGPENPVSLRGPATDAPPNSFGGPRRVN